MADLIITPSLGKIDFIHQSAQAPRFESIILHEEDGLVFTGKISAASVTAPLNVINVTAGSSNVNYPFIFASSGETGAKSLLMDSAGGTYNPSTNTATIDISGNSATTTLASNSTQLNGQAASYYTNIPARLGYTPVNQAGDTVSGNLTVNGNFSVNGSFTAFSASNIYISSSVLTVEDNILTLNAFSPYLRYAGIEMYDSGSGTLSSLLWDGEGDYFFLTGSTVNGKIITGPDAQANLTANFVPKATAGNKLGNSLIFDNGTNVGISTTTPSSNLHIYSLTGPELRLSAGGTGTGGLRFIKGDSGESYINNQDSYAIRFQIAGSTRMSILADNSVGIGTTVPVARLQVNSTTSGDTLFRTDGTNGTLFSVVDDLSDSLMSVNNSAGLPVLEVFADDRIVAGQYGQDDLVVRNNYVGIGTNNPTAKLYVTSSTSIPSALFLGGNVGIGTSILTTKFNVYDTSSSNTDEVFLGTIGSDQLVGGRSGGSFGIATKSTSNGNLILTANAGMYFRTGGSNDRMFIKNDGNVGIGTTVPNDKLSIISDAYLY